MRINPLNNYYTQATPSSTSSTQQTKTAAPKHSTYDSYTPSQSRSNTGVSTFAIDKGTASHTTIHVNRTDYDKILNASVNSTNKPDEFGKDMNKRWVVINGQRFECELSPEEKRAMREGQKTLIDYFIESEESNAKKNTDKVTKTEDIKSAYLTKRYGSSSATPEENDIVLQVLIQAGLA